jgi:protein TonB
VRTKLTPLACLLAFGVLVLPACGGEEASKPRPAAESVPRQEVQGVERRVGDLEKEIIKLRQDLEGVRNEQSSAEDAGADGAPADPSAPGTGTADAGAGAGSGSGTGSGSGSGSGRGSGVGGTDEGGGPDPGTREDDPGIEDICGENPAPTC